MRAERRWQVGLICLVLMALLTPAAWAIDVCGQESVFVNGETVDIDCATGGVYIFSGTVNLVEGGEVTDLLPFAGAFANIYGGTIAGGDYGLSFGSEASVTIYATSAEVDFSTLTDGQPDPIGHNDFDMVEITDTYIKNIGTEYAGGTIYFDLIGTYQDANETPFVIPCALDHNAKIDLNVPQPSPEIEVYPALLEHDFGDVEIGVPQTYVVQILNVGTDNLEITSLELAGSLDFVISSGPALPLSIEPSESIAADIEITYVPSAEGYTSAILSIASNDEDEPVIEVAFGGVGLVVELPPEEQIQAILDFIDASVEEGTMVAYGPGNRPERRLRALKSMVRSAGRLIDAGYPNWAVCVLKAVERKTDGERRPPDFVVGEAVPTLNQMINDLISDLKS